MGITGLNKVSLIVPVYNAEPWIEECMASIRAQTYKDIELIVIEDKGTEAWNARNLGLEKATGEYVAFCDADDYLETDAIERMVEAMDGVDMVVGSFRKFGNFEQIVQFGPTKLNLKEIARYVTWNLREPMRYQSLSGCWAKLYRRSLIGRFPDLTTAEDMTFNFDYLMRCKEVWFIRDIVYNNRKRQGSLSTTFDPNDKRGLFGFLDALRYVKRFLAEFYPADEIEDALDNSKVYHSMLYFMRICAQDGGSMNESFKKLYP